MKVIEAFVMFKKVLFNTTELPTLMSVKCNTAGSQIAADYDDGVGQCVGVRE